MNVVKSVLFAALGALIGSGCAGGTLHIACDDAQCSASCEEFGNHGACTPNAEGALTCICSPPLDVPGGLSTSQATGGAVQRSGGGYQLSLTVGPVSIGSERHDATHRVEIGPRAVADPGREP